MSNKNRNEKNRNPKKTNKAGVLTLTLCPRCKADFRNSGHFLVKKGWQEQKETCDFCNVRKGFAYDIYEGRD